MHETKKDSFAKLLSKQTVENEKFALTKIFWPARFIWRVIKAALQLMKVIEKIAQYWFLRNIYWLKPILKKLLPNKIDWKGTFIDKNWLSRNIYRLKSIFKEHLPNKTDWKGTFTDYNRFQRSCYQLKPIFKENLLIN